MILTLLFMLLSIALGLVLINMIAKAMLLGERIALAVIVGLTFSTMLTFGIFLVVRHLRVAALIGGGMMLIICISALLLKRCKGVASDKEESADMIVAIVIAAIVSLFFAYCSFLPSDQGLMVTYRSYGDNLLHLTIANSFARSNNADLEFPVFAGQRMNYHFMTDFLAAIGLALGASIYLSFNPPLVMMVIAALYLIYRATVRMSRSRTTACIALLIVMFSTSMGFYHAAHDLLSGMDLSKVLSTSYGLVFERGLYKMGLIEMISSQRPFGAAIAILAAIMFLLFTKKDMEWQTWTLLGFLTGSLVWFNMHMFLYAALVMVFYTVLNQRFSWHLLIIAFLLVAPKVMWTAPVVAGFLKFSLGWLVQPLTLAHFFSFWLVNWGVLIVLALLSYNRMGHHQYVYGALLVTLAVINTLQLEPFAWNSHKLLDPALIFSAPFVAMFLADLAKRGRAWKAMVLCLIALLTLTGLHSFGVAFAMRSPIVTNEDLQVGAWLDAVLPDDAKVLTAPHNSPVNMLAGRSIFLGYVGHVGWQGYEYGGRLETTRELARAGTLTSFCQVWRSTGLTHVVVGPSEREGQIDLVSGLAAATNPRLYAFNELAYLRWNWLIAEYGQAPNIWRVFKPVCA